MTTSEPTLPDSWKAATVFCPYCSGDGCGCCNGTGDLMKHLLNEAYRLGQESALTKMREVYQVTLLAGRTVAELGVPDDLKVRLGL